MKKTTKNTKIILYTLIIVLILTMGVCSFLVVKDILQKRLQADILANNTVHFKEIPKECLREVDDLSKVIPITNCEISDYTIKEDENQTSSEIVANITFNQKDNKLTTNIFINNKKVVSSLFSVEGNTLNYPKFNKLNDDIIYAYIENNDQMETSNIIIFNNEAETLLETTESKIILKEDNSIYIQKYLSESTICNDEENEYKVVYTNYTYEIEDNQLIKKYTENITCNKYKMD